MPANLLIPATNLQHPYGFSKLILEYLSKTWIASFSLSSINHLGGQRKAIKHLNELFTNNGFQIVGVHGSYQLWLVGPFN